MARKEKTRTKDKDKKTITASIFVGTVEDMAIKRSTPTPSNGGARGKESRCEHESRIVLA
eukprot:3153874-Amphidinium_carterae.2